MTKDEFRAKTAEAKRLGYDNLGQLLNAESGIANTFERTGGPAKTTEQLKAESATHAFDQIVKEGGLRTPEKT